MDPISFVPIGVARTPFRERVEAPRQPSFEHGVEGVIELSAGRGFDHAIEDLAGWQFIWVIYCFHLNDGWRPKVLPPRSTERRGVFATRSPHRPNPIGMSVVELLAIDGLCLRVRGVDMVDGSPVLDIKPYVPYADARPEARTGWLAPADPAPAWSTSWSPRASEQAAWIAQEQGFDLRARVDSQLALGPQPHPYRRIRVEGDARVLAVKDWRVRFREEASRTLAIEAITSGYKPRDLALKQDDEVALHRRFVERFGATST
jgi:tRNA-Thr(GGU) m(6)t(6)A37 methyltransferase TsaA